MGRRLAGAVVIMSGTDEAPERRYLLPELKKLFALSYSACALPECEERLADPEWAASLGEIGHIHGLRPEAPRFASWLSAKEVNAYENLLLLCPSCHKKVDRVHVEDYPADRLLEIKRDHEGNRHGGEGWCSESVLTDHIRQLERTSHILIVWQAAPETPAPAPPPAAAKPTELPKSPDAPRKRRRGKKIRVHELATELGLTNKEALDLCAGLGMDVKTQSSGIEEAQADRARRKAHREGMVRSEQSVAPPPLHSQ